MNVKHVGDSWSCPGLLVEITISFSILQVRITNLSLITVTDVRVGAGDTNGGEAGRLRQLLASKGVGGTKGDESGASIGVSVLTKSGWFRDYDVSIRVSIGIGGLVVVVVWENESGFRGEGGPGGGV